MSTRDFSKLAPVTGAERDRVMGKVYALAAAAAGPPPVEPDPSSPAPGAKRKRSRSPGKAAPAAPAPAAPAEVPEFVGGALRRITIPLVSPIKFRGYVYSAITLRRLTAREVGEYFERLAEVAKSDPGANVPFPIFVDELGRQVPAEVISHLDDEDDEIVMKAAADFLPPRLLRLRAPQ